MGQRRERLLDLGIIVALVSSTALVYAQTLGHGFVSYDDPTYVVDNAKVRSGLHLATVAWAFTTLYFSNWHPLTWLSYMLDCDLFGVDPGAMHGVNLALHVLNTVLVYAMMRQLTGARWRSALVSALFALHPLHVESVAWISERKDVLSTSFGLLSILSYAAWAKRGGRGAYLASLLCLALGLLAKPMLVTWPFVFLLLDDWPLRRFDGGGLGTWLAALRRRILEKIPFFVLSLVFSIVAAIAQARGGAIVDEVPLPIRAANAAIAYVFYLAKAVYPVRLAPFYPHLGAQLPWGEAVAALALLCAVTACCLGPLRTRRYLTMGWLFYLGTLVPVIGWVQIGSQAVADRYAYVPLLGIFVMIAWGLADAVQWKARLGPFAIGGALAALAGLGALSHAQAARWRDSLTLFAHTLSVTDSNPVSQVHYANALQDQGRLEEAVSHYRAALALAPTYEDARIALGNALLKLGRIAEATPLLTSAAAAHPDSELTQLALGNARLATGDLDGALTAFRRAIELSPELAPAYNDAGVALAKQGRVAEAIPFFEEAVRLRPDLTDAARNLEVARALQSPDSRMPGAAGPAEP